jgi:hypothetical protein
MTGRSSADTLTQRVNGLVGRYTFLSADRRTQAKSLKAEASYLYGAAAAFEVVATELWEALGKHGAVPRIARTSHLSVLADPAESAPAASGDDVLSVVARADAGDLVDSTDSLLQDPSSR